MEPRLGVGLQVLGATTPPSSARCSRGHQQVVVHLVGQADIAREAAEVAGEQEEVLRLGQRHIGQVREARMAGALGVSGSTMRPR